MLTEQGDLYSCGMGAYGQLGTGNRNNQYYPMKVEFPASIRGDKIAHVSAGALHSLALTGERITIE
jgi:alpha-tubulin suppressor-like RCC1 family protein